MEISIWLVSFVVLSWSIVFLLHSLRLAPPHSLSAYELNRRAAKGDTVAIAAQEKAALLPRVAVVRKVIETVILVAAIALSIYAFRWGLGITLSIALSLLLEPVSRSGAFSKLATSLYDRQETWLLEKLKSWTWLERLSGSAQADRECVAGSKQELQHIVDRSAAVLSSDELLRLKAGLAFDNHVVEDVMTPVSVMDVVNVNDALGPLVIDELHRTGHSRFPVMDGDIHHIVGMLYLHDVINLKSAKSTVKEAMDKRVHYIHQHQSLEHALNGFLKSHRHLFVVVNDYRETVGVIALEDVLETLLGRPIVDEFDQYEDLRAVAESNPRKNNSPKGKTDI